MSSTGKAVTALVLWSHHGWERPGAIGLLGHLGTSGLMFSRCHQHLQGLFLPGRFPVTLPHTWSTVWGWCDPYALSCLPWQGVGTGRDNNMHQWLCRCRGTVPKVVLPRLRHFSSASALPAAETQWVCLHPDILPKTHRKVPIHS